MAEQLAEHHIVPLKYYFGVFTLLMVFTALTVFVARIDFEHTWGERWAWMNIVVALTILLSNIINRYESFCGFTS